MRVLTEPNRLNELIKARDILQKAIEDIRNKEGRDIKETRKTLEKSLEKVIRAIKEIRKKEDEEENSTIVIVEQESIQECEILEDQHRNFSPVMSSVQDKEEKGDGFPKSVYDETWNGNESQDIRISTSKMQYMRSQKYEQCGEMKDEKAHGHENDYFPKKCL